MDPAEISKTLGNYLAECMLSDNSHQVGPALNVTGAV
jgi:hypothetical protein